MTADPDRARDQALLGRIRAAFEAADPMPPGLPERVRFALEVEGLAAELAGPFEGLEVELARLDTPVVAARGDEESRTVTFDSESLTIMIRIDTNSDGTVRIDGWLAPPESRRIELRGGGEPVHVASDESGRFVFAGVTPGSARLAVLPAGGATASSARTVVTPVLML
jgi:hypothetical protein